MDFEKYTDKSRQIVQSAQALALRSGHQQLTPEHFLVTLLEDREHIAENLSAPAGVIRRA